MSVQAMTAYGVTNPNWTTTPNAAQIGAGPGAVFYDVNATTRGYYVVKPDGSGWAPFGGGGSGSLVLINWDASTNTPPISSGTATNVSYQNIAVGRTTLGTPIDGITYVDQYDILVPTSGGTYSKVAAAGGFPVATTYSSTWDMSAAKDMGDFQISAATSLVSSDLNAITGGYSEGTLIADGVTGHIPTFDGNTKYWAVSAIVGALMAIPSKPNVAVAPQVLVASTGSPVTWNAAQGISGYPTPATTYDVLVNGVAVATSVVSGGYTLLASTGTLAVCANATNASGTTQSVSSGVTIVAILNTPIGVSVGDSITEKNQQGISVTTGFTFTRDTNGLITISKTSHGLFGDQKVMLTNMTDPSFSTIGDGHFVDANTYTIQTNVTGLPTTTTANSTGIGSDWVPMAVGSLKGTWWQLQNLYKGGLKWAGSYGQGGMFAKDMGDQMTKAMATNANFVLIEAGINDAKGAQTSSQIVTSVGNLITAARNAGKRAFVSSISPIGSGLGSYGTYNDIIVAANNGIAALCDGSNAVFINTFQDLIDTTTSSPNLAAWSWATSDSIHPTIRASKLKAARLKTAMDAFYSANDILPVANTAVPYTGAVPNTTIVRSLGLYPGYTPATTGFSTGGSGTRANNYNTSRIAGSATNVMSIVADPGDNKGSIVRSVIQPGAVNDRMYIWPDGTNGQTIATMGLAVGDAFVIACEVYNYANWNASGANALWIGCTSNNSGTYVTGQGGGDYNNGELTTGGVNTYMGDSGSLWLISGVMKVAPACTQLIPYLAASFGAFTASQPLTVDHRRFCLIKLPNGY